jgi:hypothetical protein
LAGLPFPAHGVTDTLQLGGHARVGRHDLIESVRDLPFDSGAVARQADREVAGADRLERAKQLRLVKRARRGTVLFWSSGNLCAHRFASLERLV